MFDAKRLQCRLLDIKFKLCFSEDDMDDLHPSWFKIPSIADIKHDLNNYLYGNTSHTCSVAWARSFVGLRLRVPGWWWDNVTKEDRRRFWDGEIVTVDFSDSNGRYFMFKCNHKEWKDELYPMHYVDVRKFVDKTKSLPKQQAPFNLPNIPWRVSLAGMVFCKSCEENFFDFLVIKMFSTLCDKVGFDIVNKYQQLKTYFDYDLRRLFLVAEATDMNKRFFLKYGVHFDEDGVIEDYKQHRREGGGRLNVLGDLHLHYYNEFEQCGSDEWSLSQASMMEVGSSPMEKERHA